VGKATKAGSMSEQYKIDQMLSVEDARARILNQIDLAPVEKIGLALSFSRVLAQDIISDVDIAPFENSAMDGFALRFADVAGASETGPVTLEIVGVLGAGAVYEGKIAGGQALRIMTGAPLPAGADTVIKIEDTQVLGESAALPAGAQVLISQQPKQGANVRPRGEEALKGDVLLRSGDRISIAGVGLLASTGHTEVLVYRRPRVAILATGSELVEVSEMPGPGQIRNSNSYTLAAAVTDAGGLATLSAHVDDSREAFGAALLDAVKDHDLVVLSGGAAEGDFDYTTALVRELGELCFNRVNMRPGKAQTYGLIQDTPIFGLPGNPAAAAVGFELLVRPAIRKMLGFSALMRPQTEAVVSEDIIKKEPRRHYLRAHLSKQADGSFMVTPSKSQSSALLGALNESDCLLIVPEGLEGLRAGATARCLRIDLPEGALL
jgi:molybdopterin molybdotransferase